MSSSSTETLVDVTMPQMGVSVAEGTVVEWKKQAGDWVQADEIIASISTDKIDTDVEAPATGRVQELIVDGRHDGRGRHGAGADRHRRAAGRAASQRERLASSEGTSEAAAARCAGRASCRAIPPSARGSASAPAAARRRRGATRRSCMRIAVRARDRPRPGRGHRPRRPRAQAGRAGVPRERRRAARSRRCTSRARTGPTSRRRPKTRKPRFEAPRRPSRRAAAAGSAPLSRMRQAIGARMLQSLQTAATCTTVVEADLIRIEAARTQSGFTLPALHRARDDRDAARVPGAQRHARGRHAHAPTTASTSASRSRSARAA